MDCFADCLTAWPWNSSTAQQVHDVEICAHCRQSQEHHRQFETIRRVDWGWWLTGSQSQILFCDKHSSLRHKDLSRILHLLQNLQVQLCESMYAIWLRKRRQLTTRHHHMQSKVKLCQGRNWRPWQRRPRIWRFTESVNWKWFFMRFCKQNLTEGTTNQSWWFIWLKALRCQCFKQSAT